MEGKYNTKSPDGIQPLFQPGDKGGTTSAPKKGDEKSPFSTLRPLSDQCFCKLEGQIDDCSCKVDTVDDFNNKKIYPRIKSLLSKEFFRYFQYQPHKKCRFSFPSSGKCTSSYCQVKSCSADDLPPGLNGQIAETGHTQILENKYSASAQRPQNCDDASDTLGQVDSTLSETASRDIDEWRMHDESSQFCDITDQSCEDCIHVDLTLNPERYTGYSGIASRSIWKSIYEENCFSLTGLNPMEAFSSSFRSDKLNALCLEKRAFFRAISGLHSSITIHLAANYPIKESSTPFLVNSAEWGPNLELFHQRFDPENTEGQGPYWLKNLYFVYLLELRALAKAAPYLANQSYFTGREDDDLETSLAVQDLLNLVESFPEHFDETSMFVGGKQAKEMKLEFQGHFKNITRVMDCVSCDKCKLWGKLQITGLGTALKILFSGEFEPSNSSALPVLHSGLQLTRNEIVSLFNAFGKISTSIVELQRFRDLLKAR
ncbi:ero1-like protein isoform X2 [Eurytemora carolleeae]|uniref:ero1-like protein isoform X2 n=1 Tax=Eurytemora carolleeae TaxID=1294199 RepID=UPI000C77D6A4|nr:ero1-like protein isoform X2 [Eurytemora carolleeae]XP_023330466.1 ero1-like protein isoform X2 [Eurytemora carolleeae]|eukprot:XP_023330464.1 ero1-like protein isoform X2 [Eurytemora affinis]